MSAISACFPGIDRDLAVTGALIHDIGKIEAYAQDPTAIDLTDDGKLHGEIPLGYYLVRSTIERIDGFPAGARARAPPHPPLAPRHARERQPRDARAPARPRSCTRSTTSAGKLGSFDRLEKGLQEGETLVAVRPRDRGLRVLPGGERRRHGAARAGRRAAHGRLRRVAARLSAPGPYPAPARLDECPSTARRTTAERPGRR